MINPYIMIPLSIYVGLEELNFFNGDELYIIRLYKKIIGKKQ